MAVRRKWVRRDDRAAMPVGAPRQVRRKWVRRILNLSIVYIASDCFPCRSIIWYGSHIDIGIFLNQRN